MDFTTLTVEILKNLALITGGFSVAIIFLTVIVETGNVAIKRIPAKINEKMQELSPKLKEIQTRYKSDPQMMQRKMMEFYKEHKFNPFGGCFPFASITRIYIAIHSFNQHAIHRSSRKFFFMFINRLDASFRSHAGATGDHIFGVDRHDTFSTGKTIKVETLNGQIKDVKVNDANKVLVNDDKKPKYPPEIL
ncbi:MAG: YidC/Oxa1 family membrane protein insertase [Bacillus subtilis]|nr:YidC/Oxa1 family membrane protein insertase [Bacillus subtilis]